MYKKIYSYFSKHPMFNGLSHLLIGVGVGALLTYPYFGTHPVKWGVAFLAAGLLGHLYPLVIKKI